MKNKVDWVTQMRATTAVVLVATSFGASANGISQNFDWQFGTVLDKVNKSAVLDQIEKKKGGHYDAVKPNYNYTTYIDRQINCSVSATTSANTGTNATTAHTSSPSVSNTGSTSSSAAANAATNGLAQSGTNGVLVTGLNTPPAGTIGNDQANSGSLGSSVNGSNTSADTGAISAGSGTSDQVLNSQQSNSGMLTANITGSSACVGPLNAQ